MKTFSQWLEDYTKEHGTPPAHVMAEAAWECAYDEGFTDAAMIYYKLYYKPGDSDLGDSYGPHKQG